MLAKREHVPDYVKGKHLILHIYRYLGPELSSTHESCGATETVLFMHETIMVRMKEVTNGVRAGHHP